MRHLVKGKRLGRTAAHRKATFSALSIALIHERRITTTLAKAKELRRFIEPLITRAKTDTSHNRRQVFSKLKDKYAVTELFEEIGPMVKDRPGGYTRVLRTGYRPGDSAEMAMIELVDDNDVPPEVLEGKKKRTRRAGKSKKTEPADPARSLQEKDDEKQPDLEPDADQVTEQPEAKQEVEPDSHADEKKETEGVVAAPSAEKGSDEEKGDAETEQSKGEAGDEQEEEPVGTAADYTVPEVEEKLESMSVEQAKAFVGDDDRVTVQRALEKKIKDASEE